MDADAATTPPNRWPSCECGYACQGDTVDARIADARRHARDAHGVDVTPEQVLAQGDRP